MAWKVYLDLTHGNPRLLKVTHLQRTTVKTPEIPFLESGTRLQRVIETQAGGSLKEFVYELHKQGVPRAGNRRYLIDYRKGRTRIPEQVILRICEVYPEIRPAYLRGESPYMTAADEWDAQARQQSLVAEATGTGMGTLLVGNIFSLTGVDPGVRESLALLEKLTPGGNVARSPLHDVWHHICEVERVPKGKKRLRRLTALVKKIDGLLPADVRPHGVALETFRLGVLAAMLAALERAGSPNQPATKGRE